MRTAAIILALLLSGCADFPQVDAASRDITGPAPALIPLDGVFEVPAPQAQARGDALAARAAALRRLAATP